MTTRDVKENYRRSKTKTPARDMLASRVTLIHGAYYHRHTADRKYSRSETRMLRSRGMMDGWMDGTADGLMFRGICKHVSMTDAERAPSSFSATARARSSPTDLGPLPAVRAYSARVGVIRDGPCCVCQSVTGCSCSVRDSNSRRSSRV